MVLVFVSMIALQFSRESYTGLFASTRIEASDEQSAKQPSPKLVTEDGMVIAVSDEHSLKHQPSRLVTDGGIVIEVSDEQPAKQKSSKLVTL